MPIHEPRRTKRGAALGVALALLTLVGLAGAPSPSGWDQVLPGLALDFPRDHGAHPRTQTEWWYLTGQVTAEDGRRFGLQVTVFRRGLGPGPLAPDAPSPLLVEGEPAPGSSPLRTGQVLLGHLALTDVAAGRTRFAERLRRTGTPLARAAEHDLDVVLEDWSLVRGEDDALRVVAGDPGAGFELELDLAPAKPQVLHGERGYSAKGGAPGNASAYASWTRLATSGRLTVDGEDLSITGASWFDHEFGSSVLADGVVGWDWFGLHLDDGREWMAFDLRRADGGRHAASAGTLVASDGTPRALEREDFTLTPRGSWTSPHTGAVYPAGWDLALPDAGLTLVAVPLVADCELVSEGSTGVSYWEGPVELFERGPDGSPVGAAIGRGYAELTGYAGSMRGRL